MNQAKFVGWTLLLLALFPAAADAKLSLSWTNNILSITGKEIPGGPLEIWYVEAFCRDNAHSQSWDKTVIPHRTEWIKGDASRIELLTKVQAGVEVRHEITAHKDRVDFKVRLHNKGKEISQIHWFQPCLRVDRFTGMTQENYFQNCFIFTEEGMVRLNRLPRSEQAIYKGGQVYVPKKILAKDVNPRPISPIRPVNGLIGAISADEKKVVAMAWDKTHELFQGVIVCIHNDPHVGGLAPGEAKTLRGKIYILPNDSKKLLKRYQKDF